MKLFSRNELTYPAIISNIFYIFFTSTVLSPNINMNALYLYVFVPFLDINFLKNIKSIRRDYFLAIILLSVATLFLFDLKFFLKLIIIFLTVSYMFYTYNNKLFFLYRYIILNVIISLIQFVGILFFDIKLLDPVEISRFIYGQYAMKTGDTFGLGSLIFRYRVSGLNKEPGFFAALLIMSFLFLWFDNKIQHKKYIFLLIIAGILVSFSKVTLVIIVFFILYPFRKLIDRLNIYVALFIMLAVLSFSVSYLYSVTGILDGNFYYANSIIHRTLGYYLLSKMHITDYFFGTGDISAFANIYPVIKLSPYINQPDLILDNSGITKMIIEKGIVYSLILFSCLYIFSVSTFPLILFLFLTINVNPFTSSSFVLLGIFYVLLQKKQREGYDNT